MRSIAIINQKGGVGKTTTAVNLSAALASQGQRVCVVDMDPQAHATLHLGVSAEVATPSIYEVMTGQQGVLDVCRHVENRLSVVPGHINLAAAEVELADEVGRDLILRDKLAPLKDFDYLIIDCPPSLGVLTLNALAAVREVVLPLQPHFLGLHGLSQLLNTIDVVSQRINTQLRLTGVVLCMYESGTRLAGEVSQDVDDFLRSVNDTKCPWYGARAFSTRIRRNIRLAEAPSFGRSILAYAPTSPGAQDYLALAQEVAATNASTRGRKKTTAA